MNVNVDAMPMREGKREERNEGEKSESRTERCSRSRAAYFLWACCLCLFIHSLPFFSFHTTIHIHIHITERNANGTTGTIALFRIRLI